MTKPEFLDQLAVMLEEAPGSLKGDEPLDTLGRWDSVALVDFMAMADEHFGTRLSPRQFGSCVTVNDLAKLVNL